MDGGWKCSLTDRGGYSNLGAWGKPLERCSKIIVEDSPLAHVQKIVVMFWKKYEVLQNLLKCGFRVVHKFFIRTTQKPVFFSLRPFGRLSCWTLWPNWLFGHFKINSVDDWKKLGKNSQSVPAESLKRSGSEVARSRSPPLISISADRAGNEWRQTTKSGRGWFEYDWCTAHQDCGKDVSENKSRV